MTASESYGRFTVISKLPSARGQLRTDRVDRTAVVLYTGEMAVDDNESGTTLAAELVGVGALIGAALTNRPEPRVIFADHLQRGLTPAGIVLTAANLGRSATGPVWVLTLRLPTGSLLSLQAAVDPGTDPREPHLGDAIAQRIVAYLRPYGFAAA